MSTLYSSSDLIMTGGGDKKFGPVWWFLCMEIEEWHGMCCGFSMWVVIKGSTSVETGPVRFQMGPVAWGTVSWMGTGGRDLWLPARPYLLLSMG